MKHIHWGAAKPGYCPDEAANQDSPFGGLVSSTFKRVPYADISVDGNADDDEDTAIHVDEIERLYEWAQESGCFLDRVVQLEWEREKQQDICKRKIDHVHWSFGLFLPKAAEHRESHGIENQPENEGGDGDPQQQGLC